MGRCRWFDFVFNRFLLRGVFMKSPEDEEFDRIERESEGWRKRQIVNIDKKPYEVAKAPTGFWISPKHGFKGWLDSKQNQDELHKHLDEFIWRVQDE
jgi:hypothetical protein